VVIDNLDLLGVGAGPKEADAPLVVYSDRVLSAPISPEGLQAITWRQPEECQLNGGIDQLQLNERPLPEITGKAACAPGEPQLFGVTIGKAFDHNRDGRPAFIIRQADNIWQTDNFGGGRRRSLVEPAGLAVHPAAPEAVYNPAAHPLAGTKADARSKSLSAKGADLGP
jgi:hypothetical protein